MAVEKGGPRLFANNRDKNQIDVFDREKLTKIATWQVTTCKKNTVIALDESTDRMFVACHEGQFVVIDLTSGKELQTLSIGQGADDIDFDKETKRIYVASGGSKGSVDVYREVDPDHYESLGRFVSAPGAATARLIAELSEYVVLARRRIINQHKFWYSTSGQLSRAVAATTRERFTCASQVPAIRL